jgi:hypothetical protein
MIYEIALGMAGLIGLYSVAWLFTYELDNMGRYDNAMDVGAVDHFGGLSSGRR